MNEDKNTNATEETNNFKTGEIDWAFLILLLVFSFGWNNTENPKISELEKKVARLEGQMSMIGGKGL